MLIGHELPGLPNPLDTEDWLKAENFAAKNFLRNKYGSAPAEPLIQNLRKLRGSVGAKIAPHYLGRLHAEVLRAAATDPRLAHYMVTGQVLDANRT